MKKLVTVIGARPQFVKAAVLSRLLQNDDSLREILIHTGQHYDANMSDIFFDELSIPKPEYHLGISNASHGAMTGQMLAAIEDVLVKEQPDGMLVYGDTNSTLAGALAAAKLSIPVIHIEAGLRSYNRAMPEEINRVMTDHLSKLLLCPTKTSLDNLSKEGITEGVHHVGDVMYDATKHATERALETSQILATLKLESKQYALATLHRQENTDSKETLARAITFLQEHAKNFPIVLPLHPRTQKYLDEYDIATDGLMLVEPLGYIDMHRLLHDAASVYTDSGGLQKEAYFHQVPCVTMRMETEWVETIEHGWNRLWTVDDYKPRTSISDYGVGDTGSKCQQLISQIL
ncbi:MAG: non-hydrolyzing UDP-N-acetylglucosamine 2-epimerase [Rickettsiales bacterium]